MRFGLLVVFCGFALSVIADEPAAKPPAPTSKEHAEQMARGLDLFKTDVRQILVKHCVKCHGGKETEGEFDLTTRAGLLRGGKEGKVVAIGRAKTSRLYKLITHSQEPEMPEDAAKLPDAQIAAIVKWIDLGAAYDKSLIDKSNTKKPWTERVVSQDAKQYWAFRPLRVLPPPVVKNKTWVKSDIDRFIAARQEQRDLVPSAPANRRNLIRRAYFALIGLPPTPQDVARFEEDAARDPQTAFPNLIDRLLKTPDYGERWARHWLDVVRFAESHGFEQDYDRPHAYHYRDFVIRALNMDMPYNQFVQWQLAGDEIAPDDPLAMMATGFMGAGVFPTQLTEKEFESARYDELADMTGTMGTAMLGMTIGCARCHDHKFDPIPQADFYRIASSFTKTIRSEIELEIPATGAKDFQKRHRPLVDALSKYEREQLPAKAKAWLATLKSNPDEAKPAVWHILRFQQARSEGGATLTLQADGSLLAGGTSPKNDRYTFVARTNLKGISSVRLEALAHKSFVKGGPGRAENGNFALSDFKLTAAPANGDGDAVEVKLTNARATFQQNQAALSVAGSIDNDPVSGWAVDPQFGKDHAAAFTLATPVGFVGGSILTFTMHFNNNTNHSIGRPRLAISTQPSPPLTGDEKKQLSDAELVKLVRDAGGFDRLEANSRTLIIERYRQNDKKWRELNQAVQTSLNAKPKGEKVKVMVTSEGFKPMSHHADGRGFTHFFKDTYFLKRGDTNQKQGVAPQGFLQVLMRSPEKEKRWQATPPPGARTSHRRRALAAWITDTQHGAGHQLARVIVNRLWQHHFGRGIVETPNDFGVQGLPPTHPKLLDWLALKLIENQWRLKPMHKLIMSTAAYMQGSNHSANAGKTDPQNYLLWRYNPRRLEAEVIRDSMLAISGQLERTMYGKGTLDEGMKRRSIYFFIKRSKLIPMMQLFDSPESLVSIGDRPATTIAPQALMFMNNPHVRGYARSFAGQLKPTAEKTLADAVRMGYMATIARHPTAEELAENVGFLDQQINSYKAAKLPNARDLALADLCQVLMSLNEFIYVE
ncbi:MAG: PSD1 and planctomycete cytochrome C domain-containing protein [Pirellulales bacterium]